MPASTTPPPARRLRDLITAREILTIPGAQDALSALLVEQAGFDAVFVGDFNAAAVLLGQPDYGLVTVNDMAEISQRITRATRIPLLADSGCGFGNALNVVHTVEAFERAGAAGITIEDQVYPKRCGQLAGKQVIPTEDMVVKIRAAVRARSDPDFVVVARTDSIATAGVDEAIARGRAYADAGADVFWPGSPPTLGDLACIVADVPLPVQVAMIEGGKTPLASTGELEALGVAVVLCGLTTLFAAAGGMRAALRALRRDGITSAVTDDMVTFSDFTEIVGLRALQQLERELAYGV